MGRYSEDFLRQAAEPHEETAKVLETLIAARIGHELGLPRVRLSERRDVAE